jgi:hypothetical protein
MSDGMVNREGTVIQEDYQKYQFLGDNTGFVAITGRQQHGEQAIEIARRWFTEGHSYSAIADGLRQVLLRDIPHSTHPLVTVNMAIGGLVNGEIEFHTFSNKAEIPVESFTPKGNDICYATLESTEITQLGLDLTPVLVESLSRNGFGSVQQLKEVQTMLNDFVAERDNTVNNRTFHFTVEKP